MGTGGSPTLVGRLERDSPIEGSSGSPIYGAVEGRESRCHVCRIPDAAAAGWR